MGWTAYCDIFVPRHKPNSSGPDWKWCGDEMTKIDGNWVCQKHGIYDETAKKMIHGGIENLREAGLWNGRA